MKTSASSLVPIISTVFSSKAPSASSASSTRSASLRFAFTVSSFRVTVSSTGVSVVLEVTRAPPLADFDLATDNSSSTIGTEPALLSPDCSPDSKRSMMLSACSASILGHAGEEQRLALVRRVRIGAGILLVEALLGERAHELLLVALEDLDVAVLEAFLTQGGDGFFSDLAVVVGADDAGHGVSLQFG
jgi:hypothetical protein